MEDKLPGGKGDNRPDSDFDAKWLAAGIKVESEHTEDPAVAKEIAKDHLTEDPLYYKKLRKIEKSMDAQISLFKSIQGIVSLTKAAIDTGKEAAAVRLLSRYDNHEDKQVRRVLASSYSVLEKAKVDKTDYEPLVRESVDLIKKLKADGAHNPDHKNHAGYKAEMRSLKFHMEKYAKQQLHLEKRRNKKGVVVGKWVGAKKPVKKTKPAKKPKVSKPKQPEKTLKPTSAIIRHTLSDGRHLSKKTSVPYTHVVEMLHNGSVKVESWHKSAAGAEKSAAKNRIAARKRIAKLESAISSGLIPKGDFKSIESMKHVLENEKNYLSSSIVRPVEYHKPVDQMDDAEKEKMPKITFSPRINKEYRGFEYTIEQTGDRPPLFYPTSVKIHTGVRLYGTPEEVEEIIKKIVDKHLKKQKVKVPKVEKKKLTPKPKKAGKEKPYKQSDMYKLQIALDSVMKNPAGNKEKSDKLNWKLIEHALKEGDDKDVTRALKHVQEALK